MRAFAILIGLIASLAGAYAGFVAIRAVGPEDRSNDFGFGDAALAPPGGGTLLQSKNFKLVVDALERELGPDGAVQNVNVEVVGANATARKGDRLISVRIDASGRSQSTDAGEATPAAAIPVAKIDPDAVDKVIRAARKETGEPVESLALQGGTREWTAHMVRGEPDAFIANLDGGGLRLSGEPNPVPQGAGRDSMFRAKNLQAVLDAARKEGDKVLDLSVWPERVSISLAAGGREVSLDYGYDAQLTSRDVRARSGGDATIKLSSIHPDAIARMARHPRVKGLQRVQYVLLNQAGVFASKPTLSMFLPQGSDPAYVVADLRGRGVTWPGRGQ
jgi:hypothetical protein